MALLSDLLGGDATLMALLPGGIHDEVAPRSSSGTVVFPHLVIIINDARTRNAVGAGRIARVFDTIFFTVQCVDQNWSYDRARSVMDRVDVLLASGYNGSVLGFLRQELVKFSEVEPEPPYRHYGFMYHTIAKD